MQSTSESSLYEDLLSTGKDLAILPGALLDSSCSLSSLPPPLDPSLFRDKFAKHLEDQSQPVHFTAVGEARLAFLE